MITTIPYGIISDRYGRKPILLAGLIGSAVFLGLFGLSRSLPWAIASRALCGFFNGTILLLHLITRIILTLTNPRKQSNHPNCRGGNSRSRQSQSGKSIRHIWSHRSPRLCDRSDDWRCSCEASRAIRTPGTWKHIRNIPLSLALPHRYADDSHRHYNQSVSSRRN